MIEPEESKRPLLSVVDCYASIPWAVAKLQSRITESMMLVTVDYPESLGISFTTELSISQLKGGYDQLDTIAIARLCQSNMDKSVEVREISQ